MLRPVSSLLTNALMTEIMEMQKAVTSAPVTHKSTLEGISIPVKDTVTGLPNGRSSNRSELDSKIINKVNHDCLSVPCTLEFGLHMIAETIKADDDFMVYGAIWASAANPNFRVNVLHPLVIQAIIAGDYDHLIKLEDEGTLYVYEYQKGALESKSEVLKKLETPACLEVIERWDEIMTKIMDTGYAPNTTLSCSTNLNSLCQSIRQGSQKLETARVSFSESGNNPQLVITPLMFVTRGMIFPYYGATISKQDGGSYKSRDLMNFGSCNLDHRTDIGIWGTTCTGNHSNSVYASLRVLSNLNMSSAYHTDVIAMSAGIKPYVRIAQEISVELLMTAYGSKWITEEVVQEEEPKVIEIVEEETQEVPEVVAVTVKKRGRPKKIVAGA